jgi:hypothetical protein
LEVLNEGDVEAIEDLPDGGVPKAICFGAWHISNEYTRGGSLEDLQVIGLNEGKGLAANFPKV